MCFHLDTLSPDFVQMGKLGQNMDWVTVRVDYRNSGQGRPTTESYICTTGCTPERKRGEIVTTQTSRSRRDLKGTIPRARNLEIRRVEIIVRLKSGLDLVTGRLVGGPSPRLWDGIEIERERERETGWRGGVYIYCRGLKKTC